VDLARDTDVVTLLIYSTNERPGDRFCAPGLFSFVSLILVAQKALNIHLVLVFVASLILVAALLVAYASSFLAVRISSAFHKALEAWWYAECCLLESTGGSGPQSRAVHSLLRSDMFESVFGRLINGAVWGLGAGLALSIAQAGGTGLRPIVKGLVKAAMATSDRIQEMSAEARENLEDLYSEVQSEREQEAAPAPPQEPQRIPVQKRNS
jgi:hypothetical protein